MLFTHFIRKFVTIFFCLVSTLFFSAQSYSSVILTIDNSILTGASGIVVEGASYDVSFIDGTCKALFSSCDTPSDFLFSSGLTAKNALEALWSQALLPSYEQLPSAIGGCSALNGCNIYTPYNVSTYYFYNVQAAYMALGNSPDASHIIGLNTIPSTYDFNNRFDMTYAVWTYSPSTSVTEPVSYSLLCLAGIALYLMRCRHQS